MKKFLILLLIIFLIIPSCSKKQEEPEKKTEVKRMDLKAAETVMDNYMSAYMSEDMELKKTFYTKKLLDGMANLEATKEIKATGFFVEKGEVSGEEAKFKVHIFNAIPKKPYFSDDIFNYTLKDEGGKIYIDGIKREKSIEIFEKNGIVLKKEGDKTKEEEILKIDMLPSYASFNNSMEPEKKFKIPKGSFGSIALSPDGKNMALTSLGELSVVFLLKTEEEKAAFLTLAEKDKSSGKEEGKSEQGGSKEEYKEEKPELEISVTPVDIFKGEVIGITFSKDGKFAIEHKEGENRISLYEKKGDKIETELDIMFRKDRYSLSSPFFGKDGKLYFKVKAVEGATTEENSMNGLWSIDPKEKKIKKVSFYLLPLPLS